MKRYDTYKESGVEWIGEIPDDWKINKIKYLATVINGSTPDSGIDKYWDGDIDWVTPADISKIQDNYISNSIRKITEEGLNNCGTTLVPKGSVILTTRAPIGNVAIAGKELCTNQGCKSLLFKSNSNFYYYQFLAFKDQLEAAGNGSTFKELSTTSLKGFPFVMPSEREKDLISSYLDKKAEQINQIIKQKVLLLEKLQAKRQAIINEAVTKGLNPNAPMKPSGVEWLGDIPEHWEIKKIKYLLSNIKNAIKTGPFGTQLKNSDLVDNGSVKVYTQRNVLDNDFQKGTDSVDDKKFRELKEFEVFPRDILFTTRGTIGKASEVPENIQQGVLHPCLIKVRLNENLILNEWLLTIANGSHFFLENVLLESNSTIIEVIYSGTLKEVQIPLPSVDEQRVILKEIKEKTKKINNVVELINSQIEKLKQYRQSLISEVVTGKIKVV